MLLFSPRMRADMSAALVDTEENWNCRPGYSLRVMPAAETVLDGAGDLFDRGGEVAVLHADHGLTGLLHPVQDLLVLDFEFGIALCLFAYLLTVGVIFPGVGSDIGKDGHLVDVGIILGVDVFEFRMEGFVAGAGESGISFRHLEEGISFMEVGVVIVAGQPAGGLVGYLIGLGAQVLVLYEAAGRVWRGFDVKS